MHNALRPSLLWALVEQALDERITPIVWGPPGVGKTEGVVALAKRRNARLLIVHPTVMDPSDLRGLPMFTSDGNAEFRPFGDLREMLTAAEPTIVLVDDVGQARESVQAALMQLVLGRRIDCHRISDHVQFILCSNRAEDRAAVGRMLTPLQNRAVHVDYAVDTAEWVQWARGAGVHADIMGYLSWKPSELLDDAFGGTSKRTAADAQRERAFATPRSWEMLSKLLRRLDAAHAPETLYSAAARGTVGESAGTGFEAFRRIRHDLPEPRRPLTDPTGASVSDDPAVVYAQCCALIEYARSATAQERDNICAYAERLGLEVAMFTLRACRAVVPTILDGQAGKRWLTAHASELIEAAKNAR